MNQAAVVLEKLVDAAETAGFTAHGMHVRIGDDEHAHRWSSDIRRDVQSVAKGVCVLAAAIAEDEGLFDIDAPVASYLPHLATGSGVADVTVRHLLTMRSGIDVPWTPTLMTDWPDLAAEFLSRPTAGRVFQYSNASTYTAMRALAAVVGDVSTWLEPRLFEPLGIADVEWERCPQGAIVAGGGLLLTLDEMARLGQLIRDDGVFNGTRIVSPRRVREMHSAWEVHDASPDYERYALAGWGGPGEGWRLHGAYGQLLVFLDDAVVAVTADDHAGADLMAQTIVRTLSDTR